MPRDYVKTTGLGVKLASRQLWSPERKKLQLTETENSQGIRMYEPIDPYTAQERENFRLAMTNPYINRCIRIQSNYVAGQGFTTKVVDREEEELPDEQQTAFERQKIHVPLFNKEMSAEEIKDKIDRLMTKIDISSNIYNAYYTALQQGRCVLAITPLQKDPGSDEFMLPQQLRFVRPEYTLRPFIDPNEGELLGVRLIGIESDQRDNILPAERMVYIMHGFNNDLFSDYYGYSKLADIADIANILSIILKQDYEQAALHSWFTPPIFSVPVPAQEYGNEELVLNEFLNNVSQSKGQITAVTRSPLAEDVGVEVINQGGGTQSGNIAGLDAIRLGLIKAIIAHFGIPGFMVSEGDVGQLGGNTNLSEMDNYLQTEITPERNNLESAINSQLYDTVLKLLWQTDNVNEIPIKIKHKFNKPNLVTIMPPDLYQVLKDMKNEGTITEDGFREMLGLEEFGADKKSQGSDTTPGDDTAKQAWIDGQWKSPGVWKDEWKESPIMKDRWPNTWPQDNAPVNVTVNQWKSPGPAIK